MAAVKPKLPTKIKVAAVDYSFVKWSETESGAERSLGKCDSDKFIIYIATYQDNYNTLDTFIHEINHAIFACYLIDEDKDDEERIVATMATAWVQIYRDNPAVVKYIIGMLN